MESAEELVTAHYVYRSEVFSPRHRREVSLYLVARLEGSNVVARIDSLGLVSTLKRVGGTTVHAKSGELRVVGQWRPTTSRHHSKVRVSPVAGGLKDDTTSTRRRTSMVVETGVDPVTSRFSGARSTN
jgi:hypothetical protein